MHVPSGKSETEEVTEVPGRPGLSAVLQFSNQLPSQRCSVYSEQGCGKHGSMWQVPPWKRGRSGLTLAASWWVLSSFPQGPVDGQVTLFSHPTAEESVFLAPSLADSFRHPFPPLRDEDGP